MDTEVKEITINGLDYVRKDSVSDNTMAAKVDDLDYVIVRTYSAGVHAGFLKTRNGKEVTLLQARRLWYWDGAASLSQLAVDGTVKPTSCKFPTELASIDLTEAIEIIPCTEKARLSIKNVKVWEM